MSEKTVVLASGSPRRRELMEMLGVKNLKIIPAKSEERPPVGAGPEDTVKALARAKCEETLKVCGADDICVAADTVVWFGGRIYGKPHSENEAFEMISALSGKEHQVYTGVAVSAGGKLHVESDMTRVFFREIPKDEIAAYIKSGEPMDKAGAYGAQGKGAVFVKGIEGDFFNVMGLPLCLLDRMLKEAGYSFLG